MPKRSLMRQAAHTCPTAPSSIDGGNDWPSGISTVIRCLVQSALDVPLARGVDERRCTAFYFLRACHPLTFKKPAPAERGLLLSDGRSIAFGDALSLFVALDDARFLPCENFALDPADSALAEGHRLGKSSVGDAIVDGAALFPRGGLDLGKPENPPETGRFHGGKGALTGCIDPATPALALPFAFLVALLLPFAVAAQDFSC
jgi:hypothetical protein